MKSFKLFLKIWWLLSIIVVFLFFIAIDIFRVYDYVMNNYADQKMEVIDFKYNRSRGGNRSITVYGYIGKEKVYFSKSNREIGELHNRYPQIFIEEKENQKIDVFKFEHSRKVILIDDNEFSKWKRNLLLVFLYVILSIIVLLIKMKKK